MVSSKRSLVSTSLQPRAPLLNALLSPSATEATTPDHQQTSQRFKSAFSLANIAISPPPRMLPDTNAKRRESVLGLPQPLKTAMESASGFSLDDIHVHYNSIKPAAVQALAYTQGTEIHIRPGQEQHLPHEAWHAVQQKQGRVKPTLQFDGKSINDEQDLELEADSMEKKSGIVYRERSTGLIQPQQVMDTLRAGSASATRPSPTVQASPIQRLKIKTSQAHKEVDIKDREVDLKKFEALIIDLLESRMFGRISFILDQIEQAQQEEKLKTKLIALIDKIFTQEEARLSTAGPKKRTIEQAASAPNRSQEYKRLWEASGVGTDPQKILAYAQLRYGKEQGKERFDILHTLGDTYLPLVFDIGLMAKTENVQDFVKVTKAFGDPASDDPWISLETYRIYTRDTKPVQVYRGLNLDEKSLELVQKSGMYPPAYLHFIRGREPIGKEPEVEKLIDRPLATMAVNRVTPTTRVPERPFQASLFGETNSAEASERRKARGKASQKEDLLQSVTGIPDLAAAVAGNESFSGGTHNNQSLYVFPLTLSPIDVFHPGDVIGPESAQANLPRGVILTSPEGKQTKIDYSKHPVELLAPGRIYPREIGKPKKITNPFRVDIDYGSSASTQVENKNETLAEKTSPPKQEKSLTPQTQLITKRVGLQNKQRILQVKIANLIHELDYAPRLLEEGTLAPAATQLIEEKLTPLLEEQKKLVRDLREIEEQLASL